MVGGRGRLQKINANKSKNQGKLEVVKQEMARVERQHFRNQQTKMDWNG